LIQGLRQASEAHFNRLYDHYFQRIYNFAYVRLRNHADAEEVVQETFTAVFRGVHAFRGRSSLSSWIYGIAKNMVNNHIRKARVQENRLEKADDHVLQPTESLAACGPEEHLQLRRYLEEVRVRLESVAEWQTEVFELRHLENLSIREIARRTSRSNDAIRSSLYRVKRLLMEANGDSAWGRV
jgi:RNA polymerase sigma-70 factor (ECF subfamily)